jgi:hypothetical protein
MSLRCLTLQCLVVLAPAATSAVDTSFTYQGRLTHSGAPATASYDLEFKLYSAESGGSQVGSAVVSEDVAVSDGLFTVTLDFGGSAFDGSERWLAIGVRPAADTGPFEALSPRQRLSAAPHALRATTASSLECSACVAEGQLAFDPATQSELAAHQASADHDARYARLVADNVFTGAQSITGTMSSTGTVSAGGVNVGTVSRSCTASDQGTLRYNTTLLQVEYCDATAWKTLTGPPGPSGIVNYGHMSWTGLAIVGAGSWGTISGSLLNITTSGGPLMITVNTYVSNGSLATCRPIIDGLWAGSFGGLPSPGDPFWQEGLTQSSGGSWHAWHKTRVYPGVGAGNHTLQLQCTTDIGSLNVGAANIASSLHFVEIRP